MEGFEEEIAIRDRVGRIERLKKLLERICQEQYLLINLQDELVQDQSTMIIQNQAALDIRMKDLRGKVELLEQRGVQLRGEQNALQAQQTSLRGQQEALQVQQSSLRGLQEALQIQHSSLHEQQQEATFQQRTLIEDQRKLSGAITEKHSQIKETFARVQELTKEMDHLVEMVKWEEAQQAKW